MTKLVTRDSMRTMLEDERPAFVQAVIGKALVAIFQYQTSSEKSSNDTNEHNNVGFSSADAKSGCLTAKYWLKHKALLPWMIENWTRESRGYPRLAKYHRQLNIIAELKVEVKVEVKTEVKTPLKRVDVADLSTATDEQINFSYNSAISSIQYYEAAEGNYQSETDGRNQAYTYFNKVSTEYDKRNMIKEI